jgi:hypothetical protein
VSELPPSLQSSPARIRKYLRTHKVACRKCGYPLLGLPEPRCPECGAWTDVSGRVRTHNLRLITNRLESLGTVDDYLVQRGGGELAWTRRFDDVQELRLVNRWGPRTKRWLLILALLSAVVSIGLLIFMAVSSEPAAAAGMVAALLVAVSLGFLADGLEPQRWVLVRTTTESYKVPMQVVEEAQVRRWMEQVEKAMAETHQRPPTPDLDDAVEEVKEGCCPRCGYSLRGPRLMIDVPNQGAQAAGAVAIVFGVVFLICSGVGGLDFGSSSLLTCAAVIAVGAGSILMGVLLLRRRQEAPAVPNWKGPPQCSACGWRREGVRLNSTRDVPDHSAP